MFVKADSFKLDIFLGVIITVAVSSYVIGRSKRIKKRNALKRLIKERQQYRHKQFQKLEADLNNNQLATGSLQAECENNAVELIEQMKNGKVRVSDVLEYFTLKALNLQKEHNCITTFVPNTLQQIDELDRDNSKNEKMLYGLPVSVKECVGFEGQDSTLGMSVYLGRNNIEDSVIVKTLKHCGAIPFARTNLPQTLLSFESSNPIYGETNNPQNKDFGPGGSSSGEGCLIGGGGSLLGFGTDTAGSIRAPAHLCGICGFKPTSNRISMIGVRTYAPGQTTNQDCIGPLARDVDTLALAMKALLCDFMFDLDRTLVPMPFNNQVYESSKKLKIGYYYTDNWIKPVPACARAVEIAKNALLESGHTLIPFKVPDVEEAILLAASTFTCDAGEILKKYLKYDEIDDCIKALYDANNVHYIWKKFKSFFNDKKFKREKLYDELVVSDNTAVSFFKLTARVQDYKRKFFNRWSELELDAMITPAFPVVACPKGELMNSSNLENYSVLYNLLNCPAGVVTITKVSDEDIKQLDSYIGHYDDPWDARIKEMNCSSINMPVSVQCVGLPYQDEMCLRVMKEVETLCKQ